MTPEQTVCVAPILTNARRCLYSPPQAPKKWGQKNPNLIGSHSDPVEMSSRWWILELTDWWHQQEETHWRFADLLNVAHNLRSIIPPGDGTDSHSSLGRDVIGWNQATTTGETLWKKVIVRQCVWANHGILAGEDAALRTTNTENNSKWQTRLREHHWTEWAMSTTRWKCGGAAKTYVLHRKNLVLDASIQQPYDTFGTRKRSSQHSGHSFNMMVQVHLNCQKDHLCHQLRLQ